MGLRTLGAFLVGQGHAIRLVAGHRHALFVGALFVLVAAFAREYDGEDLLHQPWHLGIPFVASLATSAVLFVILRLALPSRESGERPTRIAYGSLLRAYWWTAPLALVYAVPVERFLEPGGATAANLLLLLLVSLWRVVLITRAVSVLANVSFGEALFPVLLFADAVALTLLFVVPLPVVSLMGGIRLTESESLISDVSCAVMSLGILAALPLLLGTSVNALWLRRSDPKQRRPRWLDVAPYVLAAIIWTALLLPSLGVNLPALAIVVGPLLLVPVGSAVRRRLRRKTASAPLHDPVDDPAQADVPVPRTSPSSRRGVSLPLAAFIACALLVWVPILPTTQPEQQRRREVEVAVRAGDYDRVASLLRENGREAFPPHWDPPPRPGYGESRPEPELMLSALLALDAPVWFVALVVDKVEQAGRFERDEPLRGTLLSALEGYAHLRELARLRPAPLRDFATPRLRGKPSDVPGWLAAVLPADAGP